MEDAAGAFFVALLKSVYKLPERWDKVLSELAMDASADVHTWW